MFDIIALNLGKGMIYTSGIILGGFLIISAITTLWRKCFQYFWLKVKHLFFAKDELWWFNVVTSESYPDELIEFSRQGDIMKVKWSDWPSLIGYQYIKIKEGEIPDYLLNKPIPKDYHYYSNVQEG